MMRRTLLLYILALAVVGVMAGCGEAKKEGKANPETAKGGKNTKEVRKTEAHIDSVSSPASKGVIQSVVDVPVYSLISSVVTGVNVRQGQTVKAGQLLVSLKSTEIENEIAICKSQIQQAQFQYESIIVGQGYEIDNPQLIPEKIKKAARIRSSLSLYEEQLKILQQQLGQCKVHAPVSGVVSDVAIHKHELAQQGVPLCRIIDPNHFHVDFTILESEVSQFHVGSVVSVTTLSYPQEEHTARVTGIKPKVEDTGMIFIRATIEDHVHLMAGMTAFVRLKK